MRTHPAGLLVQLCGRISHYMNMAMGLPPFPILHSPFAFAFALVVYTIVVIKNKLISTMKTMKTTNINRNRNRNKKSL